MTKYFVKKFDSLYEYNEFLRHGTTQPSFNPNDGAFCERSPEWYGTRSYDEAERFMMNGCHDMATAMRDKMNGVHGDNEGYFRESVTQTRLQRGPVGYRVNIGAFVSGSKKCMLRKVRQRIQYPVINIMYNSGACCGVSADDLIETNSRVLRAIQMLELNRGIRVNLYVSQLSSGGSSYVAGPIVRIKDSDAIMDTEKIAYPMISPSMLRRQKFRYLEVYEGMPSCYADGYGRSLNDSDVMRDAAKECHIPIDVCLTYYEAKELTDEQLMARFTSIQPRG